MKNYNVEMKSSGQFQQGHNPWNKDKPVSIIASRKSQFKKGHLPTNTREDFAITIRGNRNNEKHYWVRLEVRKWIQLHRFLWERENGPVPEGMILACQDGNSLNFLPDNWKLVSMKDNLARNRRKSLQEIPCKQCGESFRPKVPVQIFCSRKCYKESARGPFQTKKCLECGKTFDTTRPNKVYCCRTCGNKAARDRHIQKKKEEGKKQTCPVCEKSFRSKQGKKYCSAKCRQALQKNKARGLDNTRAIIRARKDISKAAIRDRQQLLTEKRRQAAIEASPDTSGMISIRIDRRTVIFRPAGTDPEQARKAFMKKYQNSL